MDVVLMFCASWEYKNLPANFKYISTGATNFGDDVACGQTVMSKI